MIPHPLEILYGAGTALACGQDGEIHAEELHGLFAGDTRVLSTYRVTIAGHPWRVLARTRPGPSTAQWDMQNPTIRTPSGDLLEGTVHFRLRRRVLGALHDDLTITSFAGRATTLRLSLQIDADFADVFQVKERSTSARLGVLRVSNADTMSFVYERQGFRRGTHVCFAASHTRPTFVGSHAVFDVVLDPGQPWKCCVTAVPELGDRRLQFQGDPHAADITPKRANTLTMKAKPLLLAPFRRGCADLERLAAGDEGPSYVAAGAPWFLALFGRDTLVTSLMAGLLGPTYGDGALTSLGLTQARVRDDYRDAQPGKIAHELRRGELAYFHAIPHTPYYGTHDAPALFVLALWNVFRWTGDRELLKAHLPHAEAALRWCEEFGDADRDGFLEYETKSPKGYRNQGWKDAGDAILHEDGRYADLPIATVELQGYWYAARLAMAELLDVMGEPERAGTLRAEARTLRRLVEERFWIEEADCYAMALDADKRLVRSISSNPGHLLWCGLPSAERARRLTRRLLADDMFSGYGIRTLSSTHRSYNPLSYQLGSVWPHDSAIIAAGVARYGLHDEAARILKGILEAAATFEQCRIPELFCGFSQDDGLPVPYEKANVPQAWAAAVPVLAAQVFLGLLPDAVNGRCYIAPWLPAWLPSLELRGIEVGSGQLDVKIVGSGPQTRIEGCHHAGFELISEAPAAPLWGTTV